MSRCQEMVKRRYMQDPDNKVYLFMESYENLKNKDVLTDQLRSLVLLKMCSKSGEKPLSESGDAILHYVLGYSKRPSDEVLLNQFLKNAQKRSDPIVFLDMCYFLNWFDHAKEFAHQHHLNHELLFGSDANVPRDSNCSQKFANWIIAERAESDLNILRAKTEAELSGFLFRFVDGQKQSVLCEMAVRGYIWDAFILMALVFPDHEMVGLLRSCLWEKYNLGWIDQITSAPIEGTYESLTKLGLNSKCCYLLLRKILESRSITAYVRRTTYSSMHVCLLSAVMESKGDNSAREMMEDYFRLVSTHPDILNECLPALQKVYFKQAFVVMHDIISVILPLCQIPMNSSVAILEDDSSSVFSRLVDSWVVRGILPPDSLSPDIHEEVHKGISDVIYSFTGDVLDLSSLFSEGFDYRAHVLLSLRIAEVLFKPRSASSYSHTIYELMHQCGRKRDFLTGLLGGQEISIPPVRSNKSLIAAIGECLLLVYRMYQKDSYYTEALVRCNRKLKQPRSVNVPSSDTVFPIDATGSSELLPTAGAEGSISHNHQGNVNKKETPSVAKKTENGTTFVSSVDNIPDKANSIVVSQSLNESMPSYAAAQGSPMLITDDADQEIHGSISVDNCKFFPSKDLHRDTFVISAENHISNNEACAITKPPPTELDRMFEESIIVEKVTSIVSYDNLPVTTNCTEILPSNKEKMLSFFGPIRNI